MWLSWLIERLRDTLQEKNDIQVQIGVEGNFAAPFGLYYDKENKVLYICDVKSLEMKG